MQETQAINSVREHTYSTVLTWTGNKGQGTSAYDAYDRDYEVVCAGKTAIQGSDSQPSHLFKGFFCSVMMFPPPIPSAIVKG